jgi:2,5-diketo-D-gluconate reductase A
VRDSGIDRAELFIGTKFNLPWHGRDLVRQAFEASTRRLGTSYIDLLMIHWPNPAEDRFVDAWLGMVDLLREGKLRAIGMSNFKPAHLTRLLAGSDVVPDVNQIQLNPSIVRAEERAFHQKHGIVTQAWSPSGKEAVRTHFDIGRIAREHGKTPAQIALRWHIQLGIVPLPCSHVRSRMADNLDVFGFELTPAQMATISALDGTAKDVPDSDLFGH